VILNDKPNGLLVFSSARIFIASKQRSLPNGVKTAIKLFRKFQKTVDTFDNTENPKDVSGIPLNKEKRKQSDAHENPKTTQYSRRVFQSYRYLQSRLHQKTLTIPISSPPKEPKEFENHNVVFKIFAALKLQQPRQ